MLMITNTNAGAKLANGGASIVVNADGSETLAPVGLLTLGKIYYAAQNGLAAALAAAGSNGHVVVADAQAVTTALTVPAGATLEVKQGGVLTFSGSGALTINGTFQAGLYQVFSGGSPTFAAGSIEAARPEWWGAKGDANGTGTTGTDNRAAFDGMLASGTLRFQLARGTYRVNTADASGNAVTLPGSGVEFRGAGMALTTIMVTCAVTWVVKATAARTACRDFGVNVVGGGSATYGVGVSTASTGSAESCAFRDIESSSGGGGTVANSFAVGPDNPGSSNMDIAETSFLRCRANAPTNAGFLVGNGTAGNILCTWFSHCLAVSGAYGVYAAKTGFVWSGGAMSTHTTSDFAGLPQGVDPIVIEGVRSEGSAGLWAMGGSTGSVNVAIRSVQWFGTAIVASGKWVDHGCPGSFSMDAVECLTTLAVTPVISITPGTLGCAQLRSVASQAAFPGAIFVGGTATACVVTGYSQLNSSSGVTAITPFAVIGTGGTPGPFSFSTPGGGFFVKEGSNAKQGIATLVAGTVTVANTSVTASSRVQLTAQDNNTTGVPRVSARTAGTSFTITSSVGTDTGVVAYEIFEPA